MAIPTFTKSREEKRSPSNGLYVAPILSLTKNRMDGNSNIGMWIEPGYSLLFNNKFAMSFALQLGRAYFAYDNGLTKRGSHKSDTWQMDLK